MALTFNLSDLSSPQLSAVTGRKVPRPYTVALASMAPYARQAAADQIAQDYNMAVLNAERAQLDQTARLNAETLAAQQQQAQIGNTIQGVGTLASAAALIGKENLAKGGKAVADLVIPNSMEGTRNYLGLATQPAQATSAAAPAGQIASDAIMSGATTADAAAMGTMAESGVGGSSFAALKGGGTLAKAGEAIGGYVGKSASAASTGAAIGAKVGSVAKVAVPALAIVAAANMARDAWGQPERKWYGEDSKPASAKFFDDPGMGLGSNVADALFGADSEMARIPSQVGEQFSHFAGGPISKAFSGDFKGALNELTYAPETAAQSFGIDKGTSQAINAGLNTPGYAYSQWANEGNSKPALNFLAAPDPITGSVSTAVSNSGLGAVGDAIGAVLNPVGAVFGAVFCFAAGTPVTMADGRQIAVEDLDLQDDMLEGGAVTACGKALTDNLYQYRGVRVEGHHAVLDDGVWKRVQDCDRAEKVPGTFVIYPVVNTNHLIIVKDIVFSDLSETPLGWDVTEEDRLDWLNQQKRRNQKLRKRYD